MKHFLIAMGIAGLLIGSQATAGEKDKATADKAAAEKTAAEKASAVMTEAAKPAAAAEHRVYAPGDLKWGDAPAGLPKGAKVAVLQGDPAAPGPFVMRVTLPAGYRVAPHHHPADENITVLSGELYMGLGETFDESKGHAMGAGTFGTMPVGTRHFAWTKAETVFQLHGMGPWGITYVNPQDDPRNAKQATK
jgi:quercetin dioxygenase-like cupin family protein